MGQHVAVCVIGVYERAFRRGFGDSRSRLSVGAVVSRAAPIAHPEPLLISRINFGNTRPSNTAKDGAAFYNRVGVVKTHFERPKDFGFSFVEDFGVALFCS